MKRWVLGMVGALGCGAGAAPVEPLQAGLARPSSPMQAVPSTTPNAPVGNVVDQALDPEGAPAEEVLSGFAAVWADATWFVEPKDDARSFTLASFKGEARRARLESTVPVRILATHGDFVEVAGSPPLDDLNLDAVCGDFTLGLLRGNANSAEVELRLFVRRRDLAPVVQTRFGAVYDDGTSVRLERGAHVLRAKDGVIVRVGESLVKVSGDVVVGHSFGSVPPPLEAVGDPDDAFLAYELKKQKDVRIAERRIDLGGLLFVPRAWRIKEQGGRVLFPLESRCVVAVVSVPREAVAKETAGHESSLSGLGEGFGVGGLFSGSDSYAVIPKGAALTCDQPSTTVTLVHDRTLQLKEEPCVEIAFGISTNRLFAPALETTPSSTRCCAKPSAVVTRKKKAFPLSLGTLDLGTVDGAVGVGQKPKPPVKPKPKK